MHIFGISIGIDRSSDKNTMTTVTAEERDRYLAWWQKFKILDRLNWFGTGLFTLSLLVSRYRRSSEWEYCGLVGLAIFLASKIWLHVLICPRCGVTYSGGLITVVQRFFFFNKCYGCDLSQRELRALESRGY